MPRKKTIADDEVIAVAREVFRQQGPVATTRDIARAAGLSQAVLYQRFGSKDELFFRAMTPETPDLETLLGPYPPRRARADLLAIGERLLEYMRSFTPILINVLSAHGADVERVRVWHEHLPFHPIRRAIADRLRRMTKDGLLNASDPVACATTFISGVHSIALFEMLSTAEQRPHVMPLESLVDVLWHGLEPRKKERG